MEPDRYSRSPEKSIINQIKTLFPSVYLTLISIIQASIFAYLIFLLGAQWKNITFISIFFTLTTFLMLVTTWNEYMMGSTVFRWIPRIWDSFLPFLIGVSEFSVVHYLVSDVSLWCYCLAGFCFVGFLAYLNMYHNARQHPENTPILDELGHFPRERQVWAFCSAILLASLGVISHKFASSTAIQYTTAFLPTLIFAAFLCRGVQYWNRIVGTPSANK